ncbi:MAG: viroplasmin family protein [Roseburia sp.]
MHTKLIQESDGLHTDAEALAFVAYAVKKSITGREYLKYMTCIFCGGKVDVHGVRHQAGRTLTDVKAMENAVEMAVIEYCMQHKIRRVDIVYDLDEEIFTDRRDIYGRTAAQNSETSRRIDFETESGYVGVCLYRGDAQGVDSRRLIDALHWNQDMKWLRELGTIEVFLTLTQKLADRDALSDEENVSVDLISLVHEAAYQKPVMTKPSEDGLQDETAASQEEDEYDTDENRKGDDMNDDFNGGEIPRAGECCKEENNCKSKTMIDLVFKYAESIKKEKMTSFHLLYAYACISLMPLKDICAELGLGKEAYESISYLQEKIKSTFEDEHVEINPANLKHMILHYIDSFEKDPSAIEDYKKAEKFLNDCRSREEYPAEAIVYTLLNRLLFDSKEYNITGLNNAYLKYNKKFMLDREKEPPVKEDLEDIAGASSSLYDALTEKIVGQDFAIQKFVQGYVNAKLARGSRKDKPAASYLFAGPPGVGKTYLARLAAETLGIPFKIYDMSEYAGNNATEGLVGFEKTWKGAIPGTLTTFVADNPTSIILLDEIEKAHIAVKMLFLQILEGARLYDKYYERYVSFENVIVIFTTNCGKSLYQDNEDTNLSTLVESEVLDAMRDDEDFPNELCSRFASGSIIMFNHLQRYYLCDIVRNKMDEVAKEITENYHVRMKYDKQLPELFLFQIGSDVDARVASSRGAEILKDCMVSYVKDAVEKKGALTVDEVSVEIELKSDNSDIYPLFVNEQDSNVLVISDSPRMHFTHPGIHLFFAADEQEAVQIIRENKLMLVVIDLTYKTEAGHAGVSNALGIESVGRKCLDVLQEKAPQIPLYVVNQVFYHAEDKKEILNAGVRGIFTEGEDKQTCAANIEVLVQQLHIQNNLKSLSEKGQCVDYRIRYITRENVGVVEFYNLSLRDVGMNDAALRRKAKSSKVFDFERPKMRFEDIIGAEQAKQDFKHFINYMHNIDKYVLEGAEIPRGVLLYGPPGTGKTSLAKALAGECDALFLNTTGAGIRNAKDPVQEIKDLFRIAYANAPAILFIDEIDVIAKERTGYDTMLEMMVNTLLTEMEGFNDKDPFKPVFVVAATNYNVARRSGDSNEVVIDPALVRRFDNPVYVGLPSREERRKYIQLLLEKKNYAAKISEAAVDYMAEHTGGKSLAFLKRAISNMTNAALDMQKEINDDLLTDTLETQLYGEKRENDDEYRLSVARHEAGHAYVGFKTGREPKFITIVSRGNFGGYVSYGDGEDVHNLTKEDFLNYICQILAGRAAEVVYYGERGINTGASSDLEKATNYAIRMICHFGMGSLGLLSLNPESVLDSPKGAAVLEEANRILDEQLQRAIELIREGRGVIDNVVSVIMDKSYIQGDNLTAILEEGEQAAASSKTEVITPHKWYVVISGRQPGVYATWAECSEQVKGYQNAIYRSYKTEEAAKQAFRSSRIGTRNIRDKKLLYHLVKFEEIEQIIKTGLCPDLQIGENRYVGFDFHAYASAAMNQQRENPKTTYAYLCVTREFASAQGYRILIKQLQDTASHMYSYEEGISKIDWDAMEEQTGEDGKEAVLCVTEKTVPYTEISYIYLPDEESAAQLKELCEKTGDKTGKGVVITVNKRMFI